MTLLERRSPPTVRRGVWAIVIDTIERHIWLRASSHIGKESREVCTPFVTHYDPTSPPAWVVFRSRVIAATFGAAPCAVLLGYSSFRRIAVSCLGFPRSLDVQATAAFGESSSQRTSGDDPISAAVASTQPHPWGLLEPIALIGKRCHGEPPESLAYQITTKRAKRQPTTNGITDDALRAAEPLTDCGLGHALRLQNVYQRDVIRRECGWRHSQIVSFNHLFLSGVV